MNYASTFTKSLSIFVNVALVATSSFAGIGAAPGVAPSAAAPDFVRALTPPESLGYVMDSYQGQNEHPLILIQDLHANYGVQKKISALLSHFQPIIAQGKAMTIGIEAAWGNIDMSEFTKKDPAVKNAAGDFLMKNAEISGMDNFALNSKSPVQLVGIDNPDDYLVQLTQYRNSVMARLALARKVSVLRNSVVQAKGQAPLQMRKLWDIADQFHAGKLDLDQLAKKLNVPEIANYGEAEAVIAQKQMEMAVEKQNGKGVFLTNIVKADQDLDLLSRLLLQQLTLEEVQYVSSRVPEMLVVIQSLIPGENMAPWREAVNSAIDFYAIALVRDQPLSQHAYDLAQANSDRSVVVVTGGFHTAGIESFLKEKKMSYVVISPVVESQTAKDEALYIKRMLGIHLTAADITKAAESVKPSQTNAALEDPFAAGIPAIIDAHPQDAVRAAFTAYDKNVGNPEALQNLRNSENAATAAVAAFIDAVLVNHPDVVKQPGAIASAFEKVIGNMNPRRINPIDPTNSGAATPTGEDITPAGTQHVKEVLSKNAGVAKKPDVSKLSQALQKKVQAIPVFESDLDSAHVIAFSAMDPEYGITADQVGIHFPVGLLEYIATLDPATQEEFWQHETGHWDKNFTTEAALRAKSPLTLTQAAFAARMPSSHVSEVVTQMSVEQSLGNVPENAPAKTPSFFGKLATSASEALGGLPGSKSKEEEKKIAERRQQIFKAVEGVQA